ncbi:glycerophosphodiester phosphodiesterase [Paenibacillus sp. L3-i20]|uniref:glycerophosphodiester phosphodiesterase n=1 Tax=Paenibacillus sp. L3-i20 TaxID=2905833 RepID=UPI001EE140F3|nr:glycerophosphodiester phosphodiesterase [Paenibacillus sp. L3-i20]GKU76135.1 glycerophosphoryl diester phosphodiesterase [Paenibacillus sp. L3-i20]
MKQPIIFAHRGASAYCPENTLAAFKKGIELGATGIETDVQRTKDGQLVLIHDESLLRTTGMDKLVKDVSYEQLSLLDAGSWFDSSFSDERVPTLQQLLEITRHTNLIINIELKNGIFLYPGMEQEVIDVVRSFGMSQQVIISSFNHYSLAHCKQLAPEIKTGILYMEGLYKPWEYALTLNADALHAYKYAVLPEWVAQATQHGITYNPFTVNEIAEMERLLQAEVAGIITDYPDRLITLIDKRGAATE